MTRRRYDLHEAAHAEVLQQLSPGWLIIWRPWARTFSAWHLVDPLRCRIVESADPGELRSLMVDAELELWRASNVLPGRLTLPAAG
ncbi:hypothetical protein ACOZ38_25095 [Sphaerisporangium viridialbum]|uniref:hypothetical protein n=1 Tax=Sphaerisporangium viridialbum TaxID=46189 RepID=UPI003C75E623